MSEQNKDYLEPIPLEIENDPIPLEPDKAPEPKEGSSVSGQAGAAGSIPT